MLAATEALIAVVVVALPSSPPPSPLTPLSSPLPQIPSPLPQIPSPLLPLPSPPLPLQAPSPPLLFDVSLYRWGENVEFDTKWALIKRHVVDLIHPTVPMLEPLSKMTEGNKKQYIANVRVLNYLLQAIPNDIYNSVDAFLAFKPHVLASRAKKAPKNHDPLALIAYSNASSSHSHANSSYSPQPYYVTHPPSVVDYDDEYQGELQGDSQEDKLTTAMMLLARAISQKFSTPTNNHLCASFNTRNQAVRETELKGLMQVMKAIRLFSVFHELSLIQYLREQMLLAMKDEAESNLSNEENDFMLDTSYGEDLKNSNIIFDDPFVENNGGMSEHDSTYHDEYREIQMLAYNDQREAENKKCLNNELKKQKDLLKWELETFKDRVKTFESKTVQYSTYKETCDELERELRNDKDTIDRLLEKKAFNEQEDRYLDDILDLQEKLSSHDQIVYKMGQTIQTIHMLGKKPNKVYDPFLKAGLGYTNPMRLKKAIAAQPKMYDGDLLHNNKLGILTTDSEETLDDAEESQNKMRHKMVQIDYEKLNALYETFVPQQELFAEQTYFSIPSTSDNGSTSKDVPSESPGPKMPIESRLLTMIDTLGDTIIGFQTRINKTFLQDTERRWLSDSQNELREFYKTDVIPMSRSLYKTLREIKEELIEEVQEMLNIFVSMEQKVNDKSPTENILENETDRLLEASLTSEIQNCVLLSVEQQKHELLKVKLEKSSSASRDI
ncbi:hypothetical protein Tco_0014125 [Tanacetum coccineum]